MDALFCFQNANAPSDHSSLVSVMPWLTELVVVTIIRASAVNRWLIDPIPAFLSKL